MLCSMGSRRVGPDLTTKQQRRSSLPLQSLLRETSGLTQESHPRDAKHVTPQILQNTVCSVPAQSTKTLYDLGKEDLPVMWGHPSSALKPRARPREG